MINEPIAQRMIAIFNSYATDCDPDDAYELRDDDIIAHTLTLARADLLTDAAILHFDLDDELHELTLIATYDRDSLQLDSMTLYTDSTATPIDRLDFYQNLLDNPL
jgi:hypothetical protein